MPANIIGHVVHIKGSVEIRAVDGTIKLLSLGDAVHEGEVVNTAPAGEVIIDFLNGRRLELAESSEALLDESVHRAQEFGSEQLFAEIAQVQQALVDGTLDINSLEPTAAGPDLPAASAASGLGAGAVYAREGREGEVDSRSTPFDGDGQSGPGLADLGSDPLVPQTFTEEPTLAAQTAVGSPSVLLGHWIGSLAEGNPGDLFSATGTLSIFDPDPADTPSFAGGTFAGAFGDLTLAGTSWTYALDQSRIQELDAGDIVNDVIPMTASDGTTQAITISIAGTDDAPIVFGAFTGALSEADLGDVVSATGTLGISDIDDDDSPEFSDTVVAGTFGSLSLVGGNWTYLLNQPAVQGMGAGDVVTDTITLTATDGTVQDIVLTVSGTDDAPVVSGVFTGTVDEGDIGDVVTATGTISISDADAGDNPSFADTTVNGVYGSLDLVAGNWTYTLDQATAQSLDDGDVVTDTLTLTASDGTVQNITITVNGTEDAPVVTGVFTGTVAEGDIGDVVTATGTIAISDVDTGDNPDFADTTVNGAYGSLDLVGGAWTYTLDQATAQSLDNGDVVTDTLTLTASDGTMQNITITVNGTEDAPVVAGVFTGSVTEGDIGDVVTATGTLSISDVDSGDNPSFADTTVTGSHGALALTGGAWTYTLNQATAQSLDDGDVVTDTLTLTASDGTVQTIAITVTGTEDAPVVTGVFTGTVAEGDIGDVVTATGTIAISDVDTGDNPAFTDTAVAGTYGTLVLVGGDWTYTVNQAAVQSLGGSDVATDIITLTATDGTTQNITITITGSDDSMTISGVNTGATAEDAVFSASGTLVATDADGGAAPTFTPQSGAPGSYGTFSIDAGGNWSYALDNAAAQVLDDGDTATESFVVTATSPDGDTATKVITVTVAGQEDAPVVAGTFTGTVAEGDIGDVVTATGTLSISDVDAGDNPSFADTTVNGAYGSLVLVGGSWTYTLDQATTQSMDNGDVVTDTLTLTASDGTVQNITITVNGTEDAPVVSGTFSGTVDEGDIGDVVTATGTIAISDVDAGDNPDFADTTVNGAYGSLDLVGGSWTYTLDQATAQSLDAGDTVTDTLTVTASDGTMQNITITVNGTEDAPVVSGTFTGTVAEGDIGDVVTATGTLSISDVDTGDNPDFADTTVNGAYGSLDLVGGSWTYTLDQATAQSLDNGDVVTDTLTLTASDGTVQSITVTVNGTEDAPVVSGTFSGTVAEGDIGDVVTATGTIAISDVDSGDSPVFANSTIAGSYGSLTLVGGNWTYTLDQATTQSLDAGDTVTDTLTLTASDGTVQNITITVNGTEDAPVVSGTFSGTVTEGDIGDVVTATGTIAISDVDTGDNPDFADTTVNGAYGSLDLVGGAWTYTLDQATAQSLDDGDVVTDTLTLTASDGTMQNITITVNGTEDAPVVSGTFIGTVDEGDIGDVVTATGTLSISDVDTGDNPDFADTTVNGAYGSLDLVGGAWTYTLDQATAQSLDDGDVVTDTLTLTASDGTVQNITITVNGTEDAPVVSGTFTGTVAEGDIGDVVTATGTLSISDVDSGDNPAFADTTVNGAYGTLALVGGSWTYTLDQATAQSLDDGDVVTDTLTLTASDGTVQNITITVNGTEDAPVVTGVFTGTVAEGDIGDVVTATGTIAISDVDTGDNPDFADTTVNGAYGSLDLVGGAWTYTLDQATAQSLDNGDVVTDTLTLTASDGTMQNITITVNGTEDAPVVAGVFTGSVTEGDIGDVVTATGTLSISDVDSGDNPSFADTTVTGSHGALALTGGAWTYTLNQATAQSLDDGDVVTDTLTLTASDGTVQTIAITVTGTEDAPVVTGVFTGTVAEGDIGDVVTATGTIAISDVDTGDNPAFTDTAVAGTYGTLVLVGGDWTYTVNQAAVQSLGGSDVATDIITLTATDGTTQNITITITGSDDSMTISGVDTGATAEDAVFSASGTLVATDADAGPAPTFTPQSGAPGSYGTFSIDAGGNWSYALDNAAAQVLDDGDTATESFVVTATSPDGDTATKVITVTVAGQEDAPVVAGTFTGTVAEGDIGDVVTATGTLSISDVDAGDNPSFADTTVNGAYGSLVLVGGSWTYTLDQATAQSLDDGDTVTDTLTLTASDGTMQSITITVNGTEDAPVVSGTFTGTVAEGDIGDVVTATGTIAISDVDTGDNPAFADTTVNGAYGSLDLVGGSWTYTLDQATAQSLDDGDVVTDTLTLTASDGTVQNITITVNGTEDAPVVSGVFTGTVAEGDIGDVVTATGTLSISDVDTGDNPDFADTTVNGAYGSLDLVGGSWTYTLDQATTQSMDNGDVVTDTLTLTASDGTVQSITITVNGTEDAPVVSGTFSGTVAEGDIGDVITATGTLSISDVDTGDNPDFADTTVNGAYGSLDLVGGSWTYTLDQATAQSLDNGDVVTDTLTLTASDGTMQSITITVNGTEDAPVVSGTFSGTVTEGDIGDVVTATGTLSISDVDTGDNPDFADTTVNGAYGSLDLVGGSWTYTLDQATAQSLDAGDTVTDTLTLTASDGTMQNITITVNGTEDAPVVSGTFTGTVAEGDIGDVVTATGTLSISDVDTGDNPDFADTTVNGAYGSLDLVGGSWTYTLDQATAQSLDAGDTVTDTLTLTASDGTMQSITITVNGTEDAPVVSGTFSGTVAEGDIGDVVTATGTLSISDVDTGDNPDFADTTVNGAYGSLDLVGGSWTYTLDQATAQSLDAGDTVTDTLTLTASDGTMQNITITVNGTEDAPVVSGTFSGTVAEGDIGDVVTATGTIAISDVDTGDNPDFADTTVNGAYGSLDLVGGSWTYTLDQATAQSLDNGDVVTDTLTLTASDGTVQNITITVNGTEDAPVVSGTFSGTVAEGDIGDVVTATGTLSISDVDAGDNPSFADTTVNGAYGSLVLVGGSWTYTLDQATAQSLDAGDTVTDTLTLTASDGTMQNITITVNGTEDAPVVSGVFTGTVAEGDIGDVVTATGTIAISDVDTGDNPSFADTTVNGAYGSLDLVGGAWTYTLDQATAQSLDAGDTVTDTLTLTASDGTVQNITITVNGTEDAPVVSGTFSGTVAEGDIGDVVIATGTIAISDVDTGDNPDFADTTVNGAYGSLDLVGGSWTYTLDQATAQSLDAGDTVTDTLTLTASDGTMQNITITVNGTEDTPVVSGTFSGTVAEGDIGDVVTATGTIAISDVDTGDNPDFADTTVNGAYGSLDLVGGVWTYTLDQATAQSLDNGDTVTDTLTLTASDGTMQNITITVNGTEDAPVVSGTFSGTVAEGDIGDVVTATGTIAISDVDTGDNPDFADTTVNGAYGSLDLVGGAWTYTLDQAAAQSLDNGDVVTDTLTLTASDGTMQNITITVNGTEDAPVVSGTFSGTVAEGDIGDVVTATGTLSISDVDAGDNPSFADTTVNGAYGSLVLVGGSWTYTLDQATAQSLDAGDTVTDTLTLTASDGTMQNITITVNGTEDAPVVSGTFSGTVAEGDIGDVVTATGTLSISDVDAGDNPAFADTTVSGAYGSLDLVGGSWTYTLDQATAQSLDDGDTVTDTLTLTASDGTMQSITITVNGTEDAPVVSGTFTGTVTEGDIGDVVTATGTIAISDVDTGDNPAFADTTVNGAYGSLDLVGGSWTYTLDQATAQSLDAGDTVTDTLTLTASDGTMQSITITVNGTEDAPVVSGTFSGTVAEGDIGDVVTATGTLSISDVDTGDNPDFADTTVNGAYGSLDLVGGSWTYTLDQATAQSLDAGDTVTDTLTLTASDGTVQNITITVNGTEDAPVVSGTFTGTVAEGDIGDVVTATGTLSISDVDSGDNPDFADTTVNGAYGSLDLVGGAWTYTLDQATAQSLDNGDTVTDTLTLTASDGTMQNITITVNGTEDAPVVSGTFSGTVTEGDIGDVVTATGTLSISDVDTGDNPDFADTTVNGAYGSLDLVGGSWTYTLDQATAQSLDAGDTVTDTLTLTASDGTMQNITITVNGTEDAPVVSGVFTGTVAEGDIGDVVTATGTIAISDVDTGDNPSFADTTVNGAYGSLDLVGGAWTYTLDQATAQSLDAGDTVTDTLTLTASDGTVQNITITVNGTEDAPVVSGTFSGTVAEGDIGDVVTATGTIAISDVDTGDNPDFADTTVNGAYGSLDLVGGSWTYTLDQATAQSLDAGDTVTDTLTLTASDGTMQNITITVNGTEDAPVVSGTFSGTVAEGDIGDVVTATGTIAISDVDTGDNPDFADTTVNGAYGSLDLVGGVWTYTLDQATAQSLDNGDTVTDTLTLTASDGTMQNITITVNGTEDAPVVSGTFSGTVAEGDIGDVVTATGTIAISDVDTGDNPDFADTTVNGAYGSLDLVGGAWTYTLDQAAAQSLDNGDVVTDTLTLTASDGTMQNITITVNGTEDAPVVSGTFSGTVAEGDIGDVVTATGTLSISDVDAGDNPSFADTTVNGAYGSLVLVGGSWTYTLDQATAQSLDAGDTVTDTLTLTASDGTMQNITITVNGTEDAPVVSGTFSGTVAEGDIGDVVTATGTLSISDVDAGDNPAFADTTVSGAYGSLDLVGGSWTYTLDQATAQSLDDGDTVTDTLTLTASDGTMQSITITVNGTEDAPVVSGTFTGTVTEGDIGDVVTATGTIAISDVDTGDNPAFADTTVNGAYGSLDLVGGSWTYTLDQATAQSLDNGDVVTDTLTLTASDGTMQSITITVNGTEDAPVVSGTFSGTVDEGDIGDVVTATGTLSISDVDTGDNPDFADTTVNGAYGSLDLVGGSWTYTLDQATAQSLDDGDTVTDTLTLTASDGTVQNITITVNGTEDAPIVSGTFTGTVAEGDIGDVVTATGTLSISDVDSGDNPAFADTTVNGAYGSLDLVGGSWTYTLDQATAQSLDDGDVVTDTLTLTASDGTVQNITITVNGTEDAPIVSGTFSGTVDEGDIGDVVTATGTIAISDVDTGDNPAFADTTVNGAYGSLNLVGGSWTYTLDQATAQSLDAGDTVTDTLTLTASDGTMQNITITVNGTEDAPVVSGTFSGTVDEGDIGDVVTATGTLSISDVDSGDNPTFADTTVNGAYGSLDLVGGSWTYTLDQATAQSLDDGDTVTDTLTLTASDGTMQNITITVNGTEDAPVVSGTFSGTVDEGDIGDVVTATGTIAISDVDSGDSPTFADTTVNGAYGSLVLVGGSWTYTLDQATAQSLDDGDVVTDTLTLTASDGTMQNITITVNGTEDAPVVSGTFSGTVDEGDIGDVVTATGTLSISDIDSGDNPTFADTTVNGAYGSLDLVGGSWTYTLDQANAQSLDVGDTVTDTLTLTASDGTVQNITITVNGTEDAPVVSGTFSGTVAEGDIGDVVTATGTIAISDVDAGDNPTFADTTVNGAYGSLDLVGGNWTYTLDQSTVQTLGDGDTTSDTITLTASDGTTQTIVVSVLGTNDAPTLSGSVTTTANESGLAEGTGTSPSTTTASGTLVYSDVEGDALTLVVNGTNVGLLDGSSNVIGAVSGDYGTTTFYGNGTWDYALENRVDHDSDATPFEQFDVTVSDGIGSSATSTIRVDISDDGLSVTGSSGVIDNAPGVTFEGALTTLGADMSYTADLSTNVSGWNGSTTTHADSGMTSNGYKILYFVDPADTGKLVAYTDSAGDNAYSPASTTQSVVFELTADPDNDRFVFEGQGMGGALVDSGESFNLDIFDARYDKPVVVIHDSASGPTAVEYDSEADWMSDLAVYQSTTIRFSATSDDGSGPVEDEVHWHGQLIAVDDHSIEGDKGQVLTMHFVAEPVIEAAIGIQLISGAYTWSAFDADGNLLGTGSDTAATLNIAGIGPIASISLEGADSSSEFLVDDATTSIVRLTNVDDAGPLNFNVQVADQDGDTASSTISVTLEKVAQDSSVALTEDSQKVFTAEDFGILPTETGATVTIYNLEDVGSLRLAGVNVVPGQTITKAQIDAGELTYDPLPDTSGLGYDAFTFALDNSAGPGTYTATMTVDVIGVNDGPVGPVVDSDAALNLVPLNATVGTVVGLTALASDPDPEDTVTYSLKNDAGGRFTIDPATGVVTVAGGLGSSVTVVEIEVRATSSDGTQTTEKFDISLADAADDFAVVHESALTDGSGRAEVTFDSNDEDGQNIGAGEPTNIATGNLLANDAGATSITSIDGNTPAGGTITVAGSYGTLVVDAATGDYTYTLTGAADNSAAADDLAVAESFSYSTNMGTSSALNVTIIDDTPQTGDFITNVPEGQMSEYQLVLTLDVSGSMTGAQYDGVVYLEDGSQTTRLQMAKDALKALVEEYHSQSDAVSVHLITFSSGANVLNGGAAYTDLTTTLNAIDSMGGSGGTNYQAGLDAMRTTLDPNGDGTMDVTGANLSTLTYFISDGVPNSSPNTAAWDTFTANNGIDSFAVGIGSGITDFSDLNAIHNVDSDGSGTVDGAIYVPDTTKLEEELLSTVPVSFGGSIVSSGVFQTVDFGADGGSITSITVTLDTDADGTPDTDVTFDYDPSTNTITNDGGFASTSGSILPLTTATHGFVEGRLIFDFGTGDYNYYQSTSVTEGDSFQVTFTAVDSDGDSTDPTVVTVQIVDGKPVASDDTDTLFALGDQLEGNVITGEGTDGGVANGSGFTTFSSQGVGVDNAVDNAKVTSIEYRGDTLDLTTPTTSPVTATATDDGSSYTYSVNAAGVLTLVNNTDSSSLDFNTDGYYRYTPSTVPNPPTMAQSSVDFTDNATVATFNGGGSVNGVSLSTPDGVVSFDESGSTQGAAVDDNRLDTGERLVIDFDAATYQFGVQEIVLTTDQLGGSYEVFNISAYHVDGHEMGLTSVSGSTSHTLFPDLSGIARIEVQAGSNTWALVEAISFRGVQEDTGAAAIEPEVINYTLTDDDGDSDTASLTLKAITNTYVDTDGDGAETGTSANDFLSGLDGDDLLIGGAGHDVVEGGEGDDTLEGGAGDDVLVGGAGADLLEGQAGDDTLKGGAGDDELQGGTGDDTLRGGEGDDLLVGGSGANTLYGEAGDDTLQGGDDGSSLYGGTGNDILTGGAGVDFLSGGAGSDILTGGAGADTFAWGENDRGSRPNPDSDTILDFQSGPGGDVLDLGDLLQGEESNPLTDYLSISVDDYDNDGNLDTRIAVDSDGGIFFQPVLSITLDNTDLSEGGTLSDQDMLNNLITNGNLNTDL